MTDAMKQLERVPLVVAHPVPADGGVLSTPVPIPTDQLPERRVCAWAPADRSVVDRDWPMASCCRPDGPFPVTVGRWEQVMAPVAAEGECSCGRATNGWFFDGDDGPGWYCGWCPSVPTATPGGAVVATVEVTGPSHRAGSCAEHPGCTCPMTGDHPTWHHDDCAAHDDSVRWYCHPDALPDCWHTPTGTVARLDVPIPMERPDYPHGPRVGDWLPEPTGWWWADIDMEVPA